MRRRPPRSTRTDTLFPYTTLFRSKRVAVRERDIAAHGVDLVCVDAGHDRLHAFGPTLTVRIGAVEQGYMGRRVSELDLLEHRLPYVGGQKIGTAGHGVDEVEADCLGIGEDPAGLMVDEGRYAHRVGPLGINKIGRANVCTHVTTEPLVC